MGWLVCQGRRSDLAVLIDFIDQHPESLPRRRVGDREVVDHPFAELPTICLAPHLDDLGRPLGPSLLLQEVLGDVLGLLPVDPTWC